MLQAKSASRTVDRPATGTDHGPRSELASTDLNYDSDFSETLMLRDDDEPEPLNETELDWGSIRSSPRDGLSTPYR